jgi:hypothetical protein
MEAGIEALGVIVKMRCNDALRVAGVSEIKSHLYIKVRPVAGLVFGS